MNGPTPVDTFLQEASELIEALEEHLLELEDNPTDADLISAVFRNLHTLKGSGEMFGFAALAAFVHVFENAYDEVRSGRATISTALIDLSLRSRDHIADLIAARDDPAENARLMADPKAKALLDEIETIHGSGAAASDADTAAEPDDGVADADDDGAERTYEIRFKPDEDSFRNGMRPDILIDELAALGETVVSTLVDDVPALDEIDPTGCYLAWKITLKTTAAREAIEDVFIFADEADLSIEQIEDAPEATDASVGQSAAQAPAPVDAPAAAPQAAGGAEPAPAAEGAAAKAAPQQGSESVRVQSRRLDELMDQLGELVIANARLNRISDTLGDQALQGAAEEIERLVTGLRDATLSIRMLPISLVFGKFRRLVRDLAGELDKKIDLVTEGGDTELDKNVIDNLSEPLVHIIRNSIDHGIETAEGRAAAGKPETATVHMSARQAGGEVLITVSDDGAGLNTDAIRTRAIDRGLIDPNADLSDDQLHQLIFEAGFSTAKTLSSVSGRGVGMDAVRSVIYNLRGSVEVKSERGKGTDVTLRLPLTLAIIDGLLVRVSGSVLVIPLSSVDECVELPAEESARESGRTILRIRDELVPFLNVERVFGFEQSEAGTRRVVVVSADGKRVGLVVDDVLGQHQTVIKSLSIFHRDIQGLAGGTILGDGSVALIIDPMALVKSVGHTASSEAA